MRKKRPSSQPKPAKRPARSVAAASVAMPAAAAMGAGRSWSQDEKAALKDIWRYALGLAVVTGIVGFVLANFSWRVLAPVAMVCVVGAILLTLATLDRFHRAHQDGTEPDTTRIFE
jgi:hypothetical protein